MKQSLKPWAGKAVWRKEQSLIQQFDTSKPNRGQLFPGLGAQLMMIVCYRFAPPNRVGRRGVGVVGEGRKLAIRRHNHHAFLLLGYMRISNQRVPSFFPTTASQGLKLDDSVHGNLRTHAFVHRRVSEISHQALEAAHVAHHQHGHNLLLYINKNSIQTTDQIMITLSTRKSVVEKSE